MTQAEQDEQRRAIWAAAYAVEFRRLTLGQYRNEHELKGRQAAKFADEAVASLPKIAP